MKAQKIARMAVAAAKPLAKSLRARNPTVASIVYGAEKSLVDLNKVAKLASDELIGAQIYLRSGNYREVHAAIDQLLEGARMVGRTPTVELIATSSLPEAVRYRDGIDRFAEAYNWLMHQG